MPLHGDCSVRSAGGHTPVPRGTSRRATTHERPRYGRRVSIAVLADIHGNLPALQAVLAELNQMEVAEIVALGDVASGPMPVPTLDVLRDRRVKFVRGNADRVLDIGGINPAHEWGLARRWVADQLGQERLQFLRSRPLDLTLQVDGLGSVRLCHGAPGSDEIAITRVTSEERLRELLKGVEERIVVCGHTHVQFDRFVDSIRIVNAGSVGTPYEAEPAAYWALLGPGVQLRRTDYDIDGAQAAIAASGYPRARAITSLLEPDPERPFRLSAEIERSVTEGLQ